MTNLLIITTSLFLKSRLLWLVISTCLSLPAFAQSETTIDSVRTQPNFSRDTVQAIHLLFDTKRRGAIIVTGGGVAVAAGGVLLAQLSYAIINAVKSANGKKSKEPGLAATSFKLSLPGLFITTLGIIKRVRFSRSREAQVVSAYEQGLGLPPSLQQLLRARYFYSR